MLACGQIQKRVMARNVERAAEGNRRDWLADDALHVVLCGTGSPLLDVNRAGPCTAVIAGGKMYLADNSLPRLAKLSGDVLDYHTSPQEALSVARAAGVRTLIFTHVVPPVPGFMARRLFLGDLGDKGEVDVVLGEDGMHLRLAPDGEIDRDSIE